MVEDLAPNTINQIAHVLAGMLGVLGPIALFGPKAEFWGVLCMTVLAAVKEFMLDGWILHNQPIFGSDSATKDFLFFLGGIGGAVILYSIRKWRKP